MSFINDLLPSLGEDPGEELNPASSPSTGDTGSSGVLLPHGQKYRGVWRNAGVRRMVGASVKQE